MAWFFRRCLLLVLMVPFFSGCALFGGASPRKPTHVTLLSINDFHGALYETQQVDNPENAMGGLPWLVAAVESIRATDPDLLLLDGGDLFQGSWPVNATKGQGAVKAFSLLGVDAAAVGNHEFDYGPGSPGSHPLRGALEEAARASTFQWLTANVFVKNLDRTESLWQPEGIQPWTILERKGIRFGVIGLSTMETPQTTLAKHVADLRFRDPVETVRSLLPTLQAAGAEVVIVVGHLSGHCEPTGYFEPAETCMPSGEIGRLLTELPAGSIDVIVAGHAHAMLNHRIGDTFVMEARSRGHAINRLDMVIGPDGLDPDATAILPPWPITHTSVNPGCEGTTFPAEPQDVGGVLLTPNRDAITLVESLEAEVGSLCEPVGCLKKGLVRKRDGESGLGDLMTDAMLFHFPKADAAFTNAGGIRADLPQGTIRREHIHGIMPFENRILLIEIPGRGLRTFLEIGTSGGPGLIQVAGTRIAYDPNRKDGRDLNGDQIVEGWERNRLCSAEIQGSPLRDSETYQIVTTDFIFTGGDRYGGAFQNATILKEGPLLREVLLKYISTFEGCIPAPLPDPNAMRIFQVACPKR